MLINEIYLLTEKKIDRPQKIINLVCSDDDYTQTINQISFPTYGLEENWKCGLAQGFYLSYAVRSSNIHSILCLGDIYRKLIQPIREGGFRDDDCLWFQEYPTEPKSYVLNGHLIVLISICEFYEYDNNKEALELVSQSLLVLNNRISKYNFLLWSKYCLYKNNLCNNDYHHLHVRLLRYLINFAEINDLGIEIGCIKSSYRKWKLGIVLRRKSRIFFAILYLVRNARGLLNRVTMRS